MKQPKEQNWFSRHKVLTVIIGLIVLVVVISAASGGGDSTNNTQEANKSSDSKNSDKSRVIGIGQPAKDGKFEFTVSGIECGKASVGTNQYLTKQAQGQFCLLSIAVTNTGDEAQTFDSSNVFLFDASNAKFSADSGASLYANPEGSTFLTQINPGNSVNGVVVFDLPKDKTPTTAELHDSLFSGGVKVNLQ